MSELPVYVDEDAARRRLDAVPEPNYTEVEPESDPVIAFVGKGALLGAVQQIILAEQEQSSTAMQPAARKLLENLLDPGALSHQHILTQATASVVFEHLIFPAFREARQRNPRTNVPGQIEQRIVEVRMLVEGKKAAEIVAKGVANSPQAVFTNRVRFSKTLVDAGYTPERFQELLQHVAETGEWPQISKPVVTAPDQVEKKRAENVEEEPWDEQDAELLRLAQKEARETANTDPVRAYLKRIGQTALISAEEEVEKSKRIEAGLMAAQVLRIREGNSQDIADTLLRVYEGKRDKSIKSPAAITKASEREAEQVQDTMAVLERWAADANVTLRDLRRIVRDGERAKNEMLEANLRLVVSLAKRYTGRGMDFLELIQEGNVGLIRAVEKFDFQRGYKFSTYATWWIRQAITRAMADQARTIRVPVHMVEKVNKLQRIQRELEQMHGREATVEELATEMDMVDEINKVKEMIDIIRMQPFSLDMPVGQGITGPGQGDSYLGDLIADKNAIDTDELLVQDALKREIMAVIGTLSEREAGVAKLRYGIGIGEPMTLEEIGQKYKLTRERIRQIEKKVMDKLKDESVKKRLKVFLE